MNKAFVLLKIILLSCVFARTSHTAAQFVPGKWTIPMRGNSYITLRSEDAMRQDAGTRNAALAVVGQGGLILKNDTQSIASAFVYVPAASQPKIALNVVGSACMEISCDSAHFVKEVANKKMGIVTLGHLNIRQAQYVRIDFRLKDTGKPSYVIIRDIVLSEIPVRPLFVTHNFDTKYGLCGSSVMLNYDTSVCGEARWAYVELTVPPEGDVRGGNYCALGFDGGMLGLSYNKNGDKVAALSVWNAMKDESFGDVPPEYRAKVIDKGPGVKTIQFGYRKEGKRCSLEYPWKSGRTYAFLLHATNEDSTTSYSAYVCDKMDAKWNKIATIRRPFTDNLITGFCSYLENTLPWQGYLMRKCRVGNAMVRGKDKKWHRISEAQFSNDDTGRRGIRVDYGGGVEKGCFYLMTGGYFGDGAKSDSQLRLPAKDMTATVKWINEEITKLND